MEKTKMNPLVADFLDSLRSYFGYQKHFQKIPGFPEFYESENRKFAVTSVRALCTLGIPLFLSISILDILLYPDLVTVFFGLRMVFAVTTSIGLILTFTAWGKYHIFSILFACALAGELVVSVMITNIGGWTSLYFVGNILTSTAVTMFIPWRPRVSLIYCTSSLVGYVFIVGSSHPVSLAMVIPLTFLTTHTILSFFSTMAAEMGRMKQLSARMEVEKSHNLIKEQVIAARNIQRALLPPLSQSLAGVQIDAIYETAEELSGDFFDTLVSGEWVYVYLTDVTGHGLAAAQITYLVKEIFRHALVSDLALVELFEIVRQQYLGHKLQYDLGLQLVRFRARTRELEYLRSNAPDAIVVGTTGETGPLESKASTLISALNHDARSEVLVYRQTLEEGASFYMFSDGAYEFQQENGREFGPRRLLKLIAATQDQAWPEALRDGLKSENHGAAFPDDLTIVRIRPLA